MQLARYLWTNIHRELINQKALYSHYFLLEKYQISVSSLIYQSLNSKIRKYIIWNYSGDWVPFKRWSSNTNFDSLSAGTIDFILGILNNNLHINK